jgi:hypothetical protein
LGSCVRSVDVVFLDKRTKILFLQHYIQIRVMEHLMSNIYLKLQAKCLCRYSICKEEQY